MIDINGLNSEQRSAVVNFSGPTLILAGAGTGKTRVITTRIAYMLRNGVSSKNVAAMTFTNKAAKEMRERVGELIGKSQAKNLSIGTFHSFCINILRQYGSHLGLSKRFTLVGTSDQIDLVRKSLEEKAWSNHFKADSLLYEINQCKNWLISPDDLKKGILPRHSVSDPAILAEVYELYERQLQLNRAIDFDDCIFKVVKLLREFPEIKAKLSEKYRYLLIDEFQDTNSSQFAIIEEMAAEHLNVCVVGDDDQSIYSWRGAMYETMEKFKTTFPTTKIIKLEQNYRCTNIILNAANSVIKNNSQRMKKTLWSASSDETPIVIAPSSDAVEEARWVASKCIELLGIGFKPADIAILYRSNSQAKLMEMALRECTISYKTFGGQSFFERREVKIFLGYLRLVANPDDHLALWRIINSPARGLGLKSQEKIEANALNLHTSPYAILRDKSNEYFKGKTLQAITELVQHIETLRSLTLKTPEDMAELGRQIIKRFKLDEEVKRSVTNLMARHHKIENLNSLPNWLSTSAEEMINDTAALDAFQLLDKLTLSEAPSEKRKEESHDYASLMTIHASKGLEFPVVFLVGCEEGLLPHKNSVNELHGVNEERRLFYVALTRAKIRLHLTYSAFRQTGFQKESRIPSRFLKELPEELNQLESVESFRNNYLKQKEENKNRTVNKLAKIRQSLLSGEWN